MKLTPSLLALAALSAPGYAQDPDGFRPVSSYGVVDGVAEIVDATADGLTLIYTDSSQEVLGVVDLSNPAAPTLLTTVPVAGEPTSVAVLGDLAVAAVWTDKPVEGAAPPAFLPGLLYVVDLSVPAAPVVVGTVDIGYHPDNLKIVDVAGQPVVVVAIENQPVVVENGLVTDGEDPADPNDISPAGFVQVIELDAVTPANSTVVDVALPSATLAAAGLLYDTDPQPEFVDVVGTVAAVSLQENNGVALIDISTPSAPVLSTVFSTGIASSRPADMLEDDAISFTDTFPDDVGTIYDAPTDGSGATLPGGLRFPDAIAFNSDGSYIFSADEGELNYTGGRGFSIWQSDGTLVGDDQGKLEFAAVRLGQYPEGRSENKGIEIEGVTTAVFGAKEFAFLLSERGSWMAVADITVPSRPRLLQILPTGSGPEGVVAIPSRGLVVTADENGGTLSIFESYVGTPALNPARPTLYSAGVDEPWSALSGFASSPSGDFLIAVPDSALPTTIFSIDIGGPFAKVETLLDVTVGGVQARYDGEGITVDTSILAPADAAAWIASEGNGSDVPNLLVQVDRSGEVLREIQLPSNVDAAADPALPGNAQAGAGGEMIRKNGFEGVTLSDDGRYLLTVIQRDFVGEFSSPKYARIARYNLQQLVANPGLQVGLRAGGDWEFFFYELDSDDSDNWAGLSEICNLGGDRFAVIERDKGTGAGSSLKKVYEFTLTGLVADTDGLPNPTDTVSKLQLADVLDTFLPYEKIECLTPTPQGDLWIGLDNDGGEVENRVVNLGPIY